MRFEQVLTELEGFAGMLRGLDEAALVPHQVIMLMDHRRVDDILRDERGVLEGARALA